MHANYMQENEFYALADGLNGAYAIRPDSVRIMLDFNKSGFSDSELISFFEFESYYKDSQIIFFDSEENTPHSRFVILAFRTDTLSPVPYDITFEELTVNFAECLFDELTDYFNEYRVAFEAQRIARKRRNTDLLRELVERFAS